MMDVVPGFEKTPRERLDEIFSRQMLGSVLVGAAASKIIEKLLQLLSTDTFALLAAWTVAFCTFVVLFVYWEHVERTVQEMDAEA